MLKSSRKGFGQTADIASGQQESERRKDSLFHSKGNDTERSGSVATVPHLPYRQQIAEAKRNSAVTNPII